MKKQQLNKKFSIHFKFMTLIYVIQVLNAMLVQKY